MLPNKKRTQLENECKERHLEFTVATTDEQLVASIMAHDEREMRSKDTTVAVLDKPNGNNYKQEVTVLVLRSETVTVGPEFKHQTLVRGKKLSIPLHAALQLEETGAVSILH